MPAVVLWPLLFQVKIRCIDITTCAPALFVYFPPRSPNTTKPHPASTLAHTFTPAYN
jgi:hypothetical protein